MGETERETETEKRQRDKDRDNGERQKERWRDRQRQRQTPLRAPLRCSGGLDLPSVLILSPPPFIPPLLFWI